MDFEEWMQDDGMPRMYDKDDEKYKENYDRIFGCKECGMKGGQHKMDCSRGRQNGK